MRSLIVLCLLAFNIVAFQNCAKQEFAPAGNGTLVEKSGTDDQSETIVDDGEGEVPVSGGTIGTAGTIGSDGVTCIPREYGNGRGNSGGGSGGKECVCPNKGPGNAEDRKDRGDQLYVCVLAGPGHSVKLAYVQNVLVGKVGTPDDVCMTAKACTDIVSQVFRVKEPARRGFCPDKNPHVHHFTDAQIQTLIDALKKK